MIGAKSRNAVVAAEYCVKRPEAVQCHSSRLQDPRHLARHRAQIAEMLHHCIRKDEIEAFVDEGQLLHRGLLETK